MSNRIPDLSESQHCPYCIWYPDVPSEDTCRQLVQQYPEMVYHVARTCAVGGYTALYLSLDILPDVHVAEEAHEIGSKEIYEDIMSKPVRYLVMNDYMRSVNLQHPQPADLNGDTAVRWMLDEKQPAGIASVPGRDTTRSLGFKVDVFNITEDMHIGLPRSYDASPVRRKRPSSLEHLLTEPLPRDLPSVNKELLIHMAAYDGNVGRYVRLRRPLMTKVEANCCKRGIQLNTCFAVWWSKQDLTNHPYRRQFLQAVDARFIMSNSLSRVASPDLTDPALIWFPSLASHHTYRKLAEIRPEMLPQILRASMNAAYWSLFEELLPKTLLDEALVQASLRVGDLRHRELLDQRIDLVGMRRFGGDGQFKMKWRTIFA